MQQMHWHNVIVRIHYVRQVPYRFWIRIRFIIEFMYSSEDNHGLNYESESNSQKILQTGMNGNEEGNNRI